jgi:hypothetical protein
LSPAALVSNNALGFGDSLDLFGIHVLQLSGSREDLSKNPEIFSAVAAKEHSQDLDFVFVSAPNYIQSLQNLFSDLILIESMSVAEFSKRYSIFSFSCTISKLLLTKGISMLDEGDSVLDPKRQLYFPIPLVLNIDSEVSRFIGLFYGFVKSTSK